MPHRYLVPPSSLSRCPRVWRSAWVCLLMTLMAWGIPVPSEGLDGPHTIHLIYGEKSNSYLGRRLTLLDDLDGKGTRDFATVGVGPTNREYPLYIRVFSTETGQELYRLDSTHHLPYEFVNLVNYQDIDGDGIEDFLTITGDTRVNLHSGLTGRVLFSRFLKNYLELSPYSFKVIDDLNGNGTRELALSSSTYEGKPFDFDFSNFGFWEGYIGVVDPLIPGEIWNRIGDENLVRIGGNLTRGADYNGDGLVDLVTTAKTLYNRPVILVLDVVTGKTLLQRYFSREVEFTEGSLHNLGDINDDEVTDYLISSTLRDFEFLTFGQGQVSILDGSNFNLIRSHRGKIPGSGHFRTNRGDVLGFQTRLLGDFNGDGIQEYALGTLSHDSGFQPNYLSTLRIHEGASGQALKMLVAQSNQMVFFDNIIVIPGEDPDHVRIVTGTPWESHTGLGRPASGAVRVIRLSDSPTPFRRGDVDGSGSIDVLDALKGLEHMFLGANDIPCFQALDSNASGRLTVSDALGILYYLFEDARFLFPPVDECVPSLPINFHPTRNLTCEQTTCP